MKSFLNIKRTNIKITTLLSLLFFGLFTIAVHAEVQNDVTARIETFKSPFTKGIYAKNVWDMQSFGGKIYIGQGNSANQGPDSNAGPIPVNYFDPTSNAFVKEFTVDEEQIETFNVLDGKLVIPGNDSRESWNYGNYYKLESDGWKKIRTIQNGIHVYTMLSNNGLLFAGLGTDGSKSNMLVSKDSGNTWTSAIQKDMFWYFSLNTIFTFKNNVYCLGEMYASPKTRSPFYDLRKFDGTNFVPINDGSQLVQGLSRGSYKMVKPEVINNQLVYIVAKPVNEAQHNPVALYVSADLTSSKKIVFGEPTAIPMDMIVRGDKTYVLSNIKNTSTLYTNIVYESVNLSTWKETMRFSSGTFARSFEELNGDFYFGLGCNADYQSTLTGNVLRVKSAVNYASSLVTPPVAASKVSPMVTSSPSISPVLKPAVNSTIATPPLVTPIVITPKVTPSIVPQVVKTPVATPQVVKTPVVTTPVVAKNQVIINSIIIVSNIKIACPLIVIAPKEQKQLSFSIITDNLVKRKIQYSSSNEKIATVDQFGNVTGIADGKVDIFINIT